MMICVTTGVRSDLHQVDIMWALFGHQSFRIELKQPCYLMVSSYNERLTVAATDISV